jgi:hypothetical protein
MQIELKLGNEFEPTLRGKTLRRKDNTMTYEITQGLQCPYCTEQRQISSTQQSLLRFDNLEIICGTCGAMLGEAKKQEVPEELTGTLRYMVQNCPLQLASMKTSVREVRYGQLVDIHALALMGRVFVSAQKDQNNDLPRLGVALQWFYLDARRYRLGLDDEASGTSVDRKIVAAMPRTVKRIIKPFLQQGWQITEATVNDKVGGFYPQRMIKPVVQQGFQVTEARVKEDRAAGTVGGFYARMTMPLPPDDDDDNDRVLMMRGEIFWDEQLNSPAS